MSLTLVEYCTNFQYILLKEDLNNALAATHDMHLQIIDAREDRLVTKAKGWLCKLVNNLQQ